MSLLVMILSTALVARADTLYDTIITKNGELKSIEVNGRGRLTLNTKVIYKSAADRYVAVENYFKALNVLLINDGPRGSECEGYYKFITLKEDNTVSISIRIGNCNTPQVIEQKDKIMVKFPAWQFPGETWVYENGKVRKIGQEYAVTPGVWQISMGKKSGYIELGIRDKHGDAHQGLSYDAWFIVNSPDGMVFKAMKIVTGNNWGDVKFAPDFNPKSDKLKSGIYTWKCIVEGGEVGGGRFQYGGSEQPGLFKALDD